MGSNYCKYVTDGYTDNTTVPFALCPIHSLLSAKTNRFSVYQYYHVIVSQKGLFKHFFIYSCKVIPMISPILYNSRSACVCFLFPPDFLCITQCTLQDLCSTISKNRSLVYLCGRLQNTGDVAKSEHTRSTACVHTRISFWSATQMPPVYYRG